MQRDAGQGDYYDPYQDGAYHAAGHQYRYEDQAEGGQENLGVGDLCLCRRRWRDWLL